MKTNTTLLIVIGAVVIGGGILLFSGDSEQKAEIVEVANASTLSVDKQIHDFGEIDIFDGVVTTEFALTNEGPDDIVVKEGTTSCGCTNAELGGISFGMHEKMNKEFQETINFHKRVDEEEKRKKALYKAQSILKDI